MATVDLSLWLLLLIYICVQVSYSLEYTSQWAASIEGGPEKAAEIAMKHDFVILGQVIYFNPSSENLFYSSVDQF